MSMQINKAFFEWALVTKKGIRFRSLYYSCPRAIKEKWYERAMIKSWRIKIVVNPYQLDSVFIPSKKGKELTECFILRHHKMDETELSNYQTLLQILKMQRKIEIESKMRGIKNDVK